MAREYVAEEWSYIMGLLKLARAEGKEPMEALRSTLRSNALVHHPSKNNDEVQKCWDDNWSWLDTGRNTFDLAQLQKELFDYWNILGWVSKVYDHVTGSRISKPNTMPFEVIRETDNHYRELYEGIAEDDHEMLLIASEGTHITEQRCPEQVAGFRAVLQDMYQTHLDKNADYSPANILGTGEIGLATRLWDKVVRYMSLLGFKIEAYFLTTFYRHIYLNRNILLMEHLG